MATDPADIAAALTAQSAAVRAAVAGSAAAPGPAGPVGANGLPLGQLRTADGATSFVIGPDGKAVIVSPGEVQGLLARGYTMPNADQQAWVQAEQASRNPDFYPANGAAPSGSSTPTTAAGTQPTPTTDDSARRDAAASTGNMLRQAGLDDLLQYTDEWAIEGLTNSEIEALLYDSTSGPGKVVDKIYPELRLLRESGQAPMSIQQIQQVRQQYRDVFRSHDVPLGFYDQPSDFTQYIVGVNGMSGKSPNEINSDLVEWRQVADETAADPSNATTLAELNRLYGITPDSGAFLSYVIDPARSLDAIQKQVHAAGLASDAARSGFGDLSQQQAELLAARGIDPSQAGSTFASLAAQHELTQGLPGHQGDTLTTDEQLAAGFGNDAVAQAKLARIRDQHISDFGVGRPTAPASGRGVTGLAAITE